MGGRSQSLKKRIAFGLIANAAILAVLFATGEIAVRWYLEGGLGPALRSFGSGGQRSAFEGTDGWLVADADLGYKLNPAHEGVNALGIRHGDIAQPKPAGLFRVIVLGDSIAWDRRGFVVKLRDTFDRERPGVVEVINAAIPGYTTYQERRLLERDLLRTEPDLVILQYCLNDNHRFLHMLNSTGRWLVTPEAERTLVPEGRGLWSSFMRWSYLMLEVRLRFAGLGPTDAGTPPWERQAAFRPAWQDTSWPAMRENLQSMRDRLAETGAGFAVVAVPLELQTVLSVAERFKDEVVKPQRALKAICDALGVPFLDLQPAFAARLGRGLFTDGLHLTAAGHDLAAEQLLAFLDRERLMR